MLQMQTELEKCMGRCLTVGWRYNIWDGRRLEEKGMDGSLVHVILAEIGVGKYENRRV